MTIRFQLLEFYLQVKVGKAILDNGVLVSFIARNNEFQIVFYFLVRSHSYQVFVWQS